MASGSVTVSGLSEMRAAVETLPRDVTLALRAVAWRTSRRVKESAAADQISQVGSLYVRAR